MTVESEDEVTFDGNLFEEPEDFLPPPPKSHFATYTRKTNTSLQEITLKLVGKSPLWGHLLWNAGIYTADYLDKHKELVLNKKILELGAAAGLPSLICSLNHASEVVCTDYPDADLLSHIEYNFNDLQKKTQLSKYRVQGYIWGQDITPLVYNKEGVINIKEEDKFDLIILSDLVFNHTEHHKLLTTCRKSLKSTGKCLVVFSPHRAWLLEDDLKFFVTCKEYQFKPEKIELVNWKPMFEEDQESAEIRSRVYSFFLNPQW